jgi:hypothetical protein
MRAGTVRDRGADVYGLSLTELSYPDAAENDVIVQVHAAGFLRGAPAATARQVSPATSCPVWSFSATAPPVSRSVSGSSG